MQSELLSPLCPVPHHIHCNGAISLSLSFCCVLWIYEAKCPRAWGDLRAVLLQAGWWPLIHLSQKSMFISISQKGFEWNKELKGEKICLSTNWGQADFHASPAMKWDSPGGEGCRFDFTRFDALCCLIFFFFFFFLCIYLHFALTFSFCHCSLQWHCFSFNTL